ncbi:MAG TPA: hypothetical protein VMB48_14675 [Steroidobacteraceae bacterium]|nr:hypothetical protein [Steroidobacteraceae bacterium]
MERDDPATPLTPVGRISIKHVAAAVRKVRAMDGAQQIALAEEIKATQPNLLASCLVQGQLGADEKTVGFLITILLVCYQAMQESGFDWPLISEDAQERESARMVGAVNFSEHMPDPSATDAARRQYIADHAEQSLLAFVLGECNGWLRELARTHAEKESDKFVLMASVNLVNCIAYAVVPTRRRAL